MIVALLLTGCMVVWVVLHNSGGFDRSSPSATATSSRSRMTVDEAVDRPGMDGVAGGPVVTRRVRVGAVTLTVEVADTPAARARGLMGRAPLPAGTGMLFVFHGESTAGFYMYRTASPLSIVFVRYGRVVMVHEMTPCVEDDPNRCEIYRADSAYTEAVEAPAGTFTRAGTRPGDVADLG